jgi:hypothetical protein
MRRTSEPTLSPRMYKQFALLTVALTGAMALFANGADEQASAASVAEHGLVERNSVKAPNPTFRRTGNRTSLWARDDSAEFGSPTMAAPSSGPTGLPPPLAGMPDVAQPAGDDTADADGRDAPAAARPTTDDIAAAIAASRLRSDAGGGGDD